MRLAGDSKGMKHFLLWRVALKKMISENTPLPVKLLTIWEWAYLCSVKPKEVSWLFWAWHPGTNKLAHSHRRPEGNFESLINLIWTSLSSRRKKCWGGSRSGYGENRQAGAKTTPTLAGKGNPAKCSPAERKGQGLNRTFKKFGLQLEDIFVVNYFIHYFFQQIKFLFFCFHNQLWNLFNKTSNSMCLNKYQNKKTKQLTVTVLFFSV